MVLILALLFASPLTAQTPYSIYTPEIHLGSATTPSTITVPPVIELLGQSVEPRVSEAPPASTELLSLLHFDFIVSPTEGVQFSPQGRMADTSFSLGEYARELRAHKKKARNTICLGNSCP